MTPLCLLVISIAMATWAGWELWRSPWLYPERITGSPARKFIQRQVRYQAAFLFVALLVAVLANALAVQGTGQVFGIGQPDSRVSIEALNFMRMGEHSWLETGGLLTLVFGTGTAVLVWPSLRHIANWPDFLKRFGWWILVLSGANALSEEFIYRGAVVSVAQGRLEPLPAALLSAVLFALAHVRGQASGIMVVVGSAVVGWFLAHAVLQTHGMFWAWCIHATQDVFIFASLIASAAVPQLNAEASPTRTQAG